MGAPNVRDKDSGESRRRRRNSDEDREGASRFADVDKTKKRTNRKEQRMKKREDFGGKFGIFVGKIPKGVTRDDLGEEFAKLNVPVPDYVDWVVKKGHAFAFWREADSSLSLEVFAGITVAGVALQVELYDTNRTRIKEERKEESKEADPKKDENVEKKGRTESDKKGVA